MNIFFLSFNKIIVDCPRESCKQNLEDSVDICSLELSKAQYWRNYKNEDCWVFGQETFYTFEIHLDGKKLNCYVLDLKEMES